MKLVQRGMKRISILGALAILGISSSANAQTITWPTPNDIATFMQNAQTASTVCASIEVAPGVTVPIPCITNMPKPPVDAPDAALPSNAFAPAAVDLRTQGLVGSVKDQAQVGVCWSFAVSSVLENSMRRQQRGDTIAPLHVIASGTWNDIWNKGGKEPLAQEIAWPYVPRKACEFADSDDDCGRTYGVRAGSWRSDPVLVAERQRAQTMGVATAGKARALKGDTVGQIVTALASGRAVYAGIGIDGSAWDYRGAKNGVLAPYQSESRGGHAVTLIGYRTVGERQFLIQNSWGKDWGQGGYVWMGESELRKHIHDAFILDATPVGSAPVVTVPIPNTATAPTTFTLPPVQLCPSGLPSVLGQCWLG
jgi:hypothetical protein